MSCILFSCSEDDDETVVREYPGWEIVKTKEVVKTYDSTLGNYDFDAAGLPRFITIHSQEELEKLVTSVSFEEVAEKSFTVD